MNIKTTGSKLLAAVAVATLLVNCNKPVHPALGDYAKDVNPPGGPLKFYAAMDGSAVDSIRANFGVVSDASFVTGVTGKAAQPDATKKGYISFPSANDFGTSTNFTISFWMNATLAQKNHANAAGVLAFGNSQNFWGNATFYAESEASTSDSMPLKIHFNASNNGDNWYAAGYTGNKRWPKMYDGTWHMVTITYSAADSVYMAYRDGVQFDKATMSPGIKFENGSQLVVGGFQEAAGVVDNYANNSWMAAFAGSIDQVRLYGTTLSGADVAALFASKK